jgi:hypothetical protein
MAKCDVCGNDYDKAFQVVSAQGSSRTVPRRVAFLASAIACSNRTTDCNIRARAIASS